MTGHGLKKPHGRCLLVITWLLAGCAPVSLSRDFLASHPRVDPSKIALMGFSQGGGVTLLARHARFQRLWMAAGRSFAAYLAFYPISFRDPKQVLQFLDETLK